MITKTQKALNDVFDVVDLNEFSPTEKTNEIVEAEQLPPTDVKCSVEEENQQIKDTISSDFKLARDNIKDLLCQGRALFDDAKIIAQSSEDPKAITAANEVLRSLSDLNKDLLNLTRQKQVVINNTRTKEFVKQQLTGAPQITNVQNNVLFNGTSAELLALIKNNAQE